MPKKILLLYTKNELNSGKIDPDNTQSLLEGSNSASAEYEHWFIDDLIFRVGEMTSVTHRQSGQDISEFNVVYLRRWESMKSEAICIAIYLTVNGVNFVDSEAISTISVDKMTQHFRLWEAGISIPQSLFTETTGTQAEFGRFESEFGSPFVLKSSTGTRGSENYLIRSYDEYSTATQDSSVDRFVVQRYIENNCDYRFFVLGESVALVIKRSSQDAAQYANNVSLGAKAEIVDVGDFDGSVIKTAVAAAKVFRREVAGVDVVFSADERPVVFEVNRSPQIDGGASFSQEKCDALDKYLADLGDNSLKSTQVTTIGRAERVDFPKSGVSKVFAKIDTGAYRTSVWASDIEERGGVLFFKLLGPSSQFYSGKEMSTDEFGVVDVENSFGHSEQRYSIMMSIRMAGRRVRTNVTLSDRSNKTYPILIGRKLLRGKFIVDVSIGEPLPDEENES